MGTGMHGIGGRNDETGVSSSSSNQVVKYKIREYNLKAKIYTITKRLSNFSTPDLLGHLGIILEVTLQRVDWHLLKWKQQNVGRFFECGKFVQI